MSSILSKNKWKQFDLMYHKSQMEEFRKPTSPFVINWPLESGKLALLRNKQLSYQGFFWSSAESTFQADLSKQKNFWNIFWIRRFRIGCLTWWTSYWTVENLNVPSKCISPPLCLQGSVSSLRRALGLDAIKKMSTLPRLLCSRPQQPQWLCRSKWQKNRHKLD